jgi:N-acetylneuraminic acid mutarotase
VAVLCACGSDPSAPDGGSADGSIPDGGIGRFEPIDDLAEGPRQETAVVAAGGEIYVIGGYDEGRAFGSLVEAYDPSTGAWRRITDAPVPMHHANAAAVGDEIFVLGFLGAGFVEDERCFGLDVTTGAWRPLGGLPIPRRRGASVTAELDGKIYVIGGLRGLAAVADVDVYDPATDRFDPLPSLPRPMDHGVGAGIDGAIYVAGGRSGGIGGHTSQLDIFDAGAGAWRAGPQMPTGRGGAAGAGLGSRLYVFGGEGNRANAETGLFDQVEVFDAKTEVWFVLAPMRPARHGMGAASLGDRIYVPGGATIEGFGATATSEVFIPPFP